eukprot:CAMPEP_0206245552 /NCGR_PEP_ID=MMETSP0047_2-20121206/18758_1 /ASSEMBLY_ACC=CAM_ASM_000192 /TAXON_ID=195065 /ORGANISM="Chroomonas mesostigmatica_cf, Strain CCMP1168" /LENGTH=253 /DNA_ID=CAMNT_0053670859 /DNA_START=1 /DNA_END=758 /DNA_ORIENTATION=-
MRMLAGQQQQQEGMQSGRERNTDNIRVRQRKDDDDLILEGGLYKRRDFLDKEEGAKSHPNRTYYFRKNEDVDKLVDMCTKKLQENPANRRALLIRASSLLKRGDYQRAAEDYSALIAEDEGDAAALYNRGCAFEKLGRLQEAIEDFTHVLALDPTFASAAYARGACQNRMGNFDDAINDYTLALERDQSLSLAGSPSTDKPSSPFARDRGEHADEDGTDHRRSRRLFMDAPDLRRSTSSNLSAQLSGRTPRAA